MFYSNRGLAYCYQDDYDKAIQDFTEAIELEPNCVDNYVYRGEAYIQIQEYDRAIEDFSQAKQLS